MFVVCLLVGVLVVLLCRCVGGRCVGGRCVGGRCVLGVCCWFGLPWTPLRRTAQNFALFLPSPAHHLALFVSLWVSSR